MHPALSIVIFTTASGAGYGLLVWLGLLAAVSPDAAGRFATLTALALALVLITGGLISSTIHLGHPERAWRAISQWRTSWLSREGVSSIVTYVPAGLLALVWIVSDEPGLIAVILGLLAAAGGLVTIYCTAMIYASLKTVHQWRNGYVAPNYLALGLYTGALLLTAVLHAFGRGQPVLDVLVLAAGLAALGGKLAYWRFIATSRSQSTAESATGLGRFGKVRLFEAPHTEDNYLMREMGFAIARKHSEKLRRIVLVALFAAPVLLTALALMTGGPAAIAAVTLAVASATLGLLVERWLFFAEAKHTVMLYYGASAA